MKFFPGLVKPGNYVGFSSHCLADIGWIYIYLFIGLTVKRAFRRV